MLNPTRSLKQYALAIAAVLTALLLMLALDPLLHFNQASFLLFFGAIAISALYGGRTSGVIATLLSAGLANFYFLSPQYAWIVDLDGALRMALFILQGVLISSLIGALRQTQAQARHNLNQLNASEAEIKDLNLNLQQRVDELRHNEERLRVANERFRMAATAVNSMIYDWELASDRVERTDGLTRVFGYSPQVAEPTGQWWADRIHPDDSPPLHEQAWSTLAHQDTFAAAYRVLNQANQYVYVLDQCLVVARDAAGSPTRIVGNVTDISDRKRAEAELQQREQEFRTLVENIPDIITRYDRQLRHLYTSPNIEQAISVPADQIIGKSFSELGLKYPRLRQWNATLQQVFRTGEPCLIEAEFPRPDGDLRLYQVHFVPELREGSQVKTVVGFARDITENKRAEASLRQSEERLRLAMEAAQLGTWDLDLTTGTVLWSEQHFQMLGYEPVANGHSSFELWRSRIHPADQDRVMQTWRQAKRQQQLYRIEYRVLRADNGQTAWIAALGSFSYDAEGQAVRSLGVVFDITRRKQAEAEREQLLERERRAREEAERANRVKDEFLAILSHELRSPLNPILGWSRLLQAQQLDQAKTEKALSTIERNAKLQVQLIDDLLDVARILRGKLKLEEAPVDLVAVIESALEVVKTAAQVKAISLEPSLLTGSCQVWGDQGRLQQIVWNLLSNAIKFTPSGGRVEVRLELVSDDPAYPEASTPSLPTSAGITVTDTGKGINSDFLPHLFQSFRQEDTSITRQHGGLGLGLSIVKYLVDAHGGSITADSPGEGQGATFTVQLPLLNNGSVLRGASSFSGDGVDLEGIKVLAVDDNPDARDLLTTLLAEYGAEVKVVDSGDQVLANLDSFQPDALVCDIGMPSMDGYSLLRQIRARPADHGGDIPAIALTAYAREDDRQRALDSGFQQHIAKPIEPEKLAIAIADLTTAG